MPHPSFPQSNVSKFRGYHPEKYALDDVSPTVLFDESLTPNHTPALTQRTVGMMLQPLTRELVEMPPRFDPLSNRSPKLYESHQNVFPRSYQYDLDCVTYRRLRACQHGLENEEKQMAAYCRECDGIATRKTLSHSEFTSDTTQKRWRYYPDLTKNLTAAQIRDMMNEVGRPFRNEACNWYNQNYPTVKHNFLIRKFSK